MLIVDEHVWNVVGIDLEARRLYGSQEGVTVLSSEGKIVERLEVEGLSVERFTVHPAGRKMFVECDGTLRWVELTR